MQLHPASQRLCSTRQVQPVCMQKGAWQACEAAKLIHSACDQAQAVAMRQRCDYISSFHTVQVPLQAPENASRLEQSFLVAKFGMSNARGDGTAWVGGENSECADMEGHELQRSLIVHVVHFDWFRGPSDAAAPSEPTPVQHEAGPARLYAERSMAGVRSRKVDSQCLRSSRSCCNAAKMRLH